MQNPTQKFRPFRSIVFKRPGVLSEKLKTLTSANYHRLPYFFVEILHTFMSKRVCSGFFLFYLGLELFVRVRKPGFYTHTKTIFINNPRSKQK